MKHASPAARKALIDAVKTQVKENTPPEARQVYLRLLGEGIPEKDVYIYLARALAGELFVMMKEGKTYTNESYIKRLAKLPND